MSPEAASTPDSIVYLVRHGQTPLNASGQLRGRLDPGLDETGLAEVRLLAATLADVPFVAILTSPRRRARQTSTAIAAETYAPVHVIDDLDDRDYGPWAGVSRDEVIRRFGSVDAAPNVEPTATVLTRATGVLRAALVAWSPRPFAMVAHDAVNRPLLASLFPELGDPDEISQRTACWNRLERRRDVWSLPILDAVAQPLV
jgi:broad specificity phosphatase PhoE